MRIRNILSRALRCSPLVFLLLVFFGSSDSSPGRSNAHHSKPSNAKSSGYLNGRSVEEVRPVGWRVSVPPTDKAVHVISIVRWCVGTPKPRITRVDVRERKHAVIIIVFLVDHRHPARNEACPALELGLEKSIRFSGNLGGRPLYDGNTSPPTKRWPKP